MSSASVAQSINLSIRQTLRQGLRLSPAFKKGLLATVFLAFAAALGRLIVPFMVQQMTDLVVTADEAVSAGEAATAALVAFGILLVTSACGSVANIRLFRATETGLAQLRHRAFSHVHRLSVLTQQTERRGSLVSRVTSDVDTISQFVQWGGLQLFLATLQITGATLAMLWYSWQLTLVVWACFIPMAVIAPLAQKALNRAYGRVRLLMGAFLGSVSETVVGATTIRTYGISTQTQQSLASQVGRLRRAAVGAWAYASTAFSAGVLLSSLAISAVVLVGAWLGIAGEISVGTLLAFVFLVQVFTGPVNIATEVLNELQNALAGWRRVISVVHTPADIIEADDPDDFSETAPGDLVLEDVTFEYPGGRRALEAVSVTIGSGTSVAVVGETGSGKTTLARLICRFVDPSAGRVEVAERDLRDISLRDLADHITLVPQEVFIFSDTLEANLRYAPTPHTRSRILDAVDDLGLTSWVASLRDGLDTHVGERGSRLSAGERQLIALIRAHLTGARIVILDEATSAIDPATEARVNRAFAQLSRGRTMITIAHRLSSARRADQVLVIHRGQVVERGRHEELLGLGGRYWRLYESWIKQTAV